MNIIVGQSGGPSVAINASLAGVIQAGLSNPKVDKIYGMLHGIDGVLNDNLVLLNDSADRLDELARTPAMALGSCRVKLPAVETDDAIYHQIRETLEKYDIGCFYYIGGNDSMDTVDKLSSYFAKHHVPIQVIGIPKTIDNDLCNTDHTPGYGSAAKYLNDTMEEIICDSCIYPVKNIVIVEIMGRDSGWLTLAAGMPHFRGKRMPQIIILPEHVFDEEAFITRCKELLEIDSTVIVACSEGIRDKNGEYAGQATKSGAVDTFGHAYLSGVGKYLEGLVSREIGCKVRSIELNIMQRCSSHLASTCDLKEAFEVGMEAVTRSISENLTSVMFGYERVSDQPYEMKVIYHAVSDCANYAKMVPQEWCDTDNKEVQKEILTYIEPLIAGDVPVLRKADGSPDYVVFYRN